MAPTQLTPAAPPATRLLTAIAATLAIGLTLFPPSTSRILVWPWAAFAAAGWLLPIGVCLGRLVSGKPFPRFGGFIDCGLVLLVASAALSAFASPLRDLSLAAALPSVGACALPYALLPFFAREETANRAYQMLAAGVALIVVASAIAWFSSVDDHVFSARNEFPFGHSNTVGSVCVLATSWCLATAARCTRGLRWIFTGVAALAVIVAASSQSRGAMLALAAVAVVAAAVHFLRRGRIVIFVTACAAAVVLAVATNTRLRDLVLHGRWTAVAEESNDQRLAMLIGGGRLGLERPLLGWGPGSVPHVFPRVRTDLPGSIDNFLHLHNSFAQTWATLGPLGLLASALIGIGLLRSLRDATWNASRVWIAAGLAGGLVTLLFDHALDVPMFAILAAAHLAAWRADHANTDHLRPGKLIAALLGAALIPVLFAISRDLAAKRDYAAALDAASAGDRPAFADRLRRASERMPGDPYYLHQLAAHDATGHPFPTAARIDESAAISALEASLPANPDSEYAHYNLGWLLLARDSRAAEHHFFAAAQLAPRRGSVFLGLGLARLQNGNHPGAVRAFAAEWLNNPAFAWSEIWFAPPLNGLRPAILQLATNALPSDDARSAPLARAWSEAVEPAPSVRAYRRVRTGYGVLVGHPDGPPPVDVNVQAELKLPAEITAACPARGWLPAGLLLEFTGARAQ